MKPRVAFKPVEPKPEMASARLRCYLPCRYLRQAGWDCEPFDPNHLHQYQVVVFQKAYQADDLALAERLKQRGVRVVFDLCDNYLFLPQEASLDAATVARRQRLESMISLADAVTVCTAELARWVKRSCTVIDDALDPVDADWTAAGRRWLRRLAGAPLRLVWFGNAGLQAPAFGMIDLHRLQDDLARLHADVPLRLTVISNSRPVFNQFFGNAPFPVRYREYRLQSFQRLMRRQDVSLIPVTVNPFTACKTVNRPASSLLLGLPAVVDLIPSYDEIRPFVLVGDWLDSLRAYAKDPALRRCHVRQGQAYLRDRYQPARVVEQWEGVLRKLAA